MYDPARVEGGGKIGGIAGRDGALEQRIERVAVGETQSVVLCEGHVARRLDRRDRFAEVQRGDQVRPLAWGDDDDHRALAVTPRQWAKDRKSTRLNSSH